MSEEFDFTIKADPSQALAAEVQVTDGLARIEVSANRVSLSMGKIGSAGASSGRAVASEVAKADAAARAAEGSFNGLGSAIENIAAAAGIALGVHELTALADGYVVIQNRLRTTSTDQANLNGLMDATYDIAQRNRTGWEDVATTYQRLGKAAAGLGVSQKDILELTDTLTAGLKAGGATGQEMAGTMMEVAHAFSVGTITGREFRVIVRDAPGLISQLATAAGKTRGEFIEMGLHGHITAQTLVEDFKKAAPAIREEFEKTTPTIHDAFTLIENAATRFFGEAGAGSGVLRALAEAARFVADHFDVFGGILLAVGEALAGLFIIEKVIQLIRLLAVAVAANPLGALVTAVTIGIALLRQFGDSWSTGITVLNNGKSVIVTVGDVLRVLWSDIKDAGRAILDFVSEAWSALVGALSEGVDGSGMDLSLRNILRMIAAFAGAAKAIFKMFRDDFLELFGGLAATIGEHFQGVINHIIDALNKVSDAIAVATHPTAAAGSVFGFVKGLARAANGNPQGVADATSAANNGPQGPHMDHVDFTGAGDAFGKKVQETKEHMMKDVQDTIKSMDSYVDGVLARAKAARAAAPGEAGSTISDVKGKADPTAPTKEQEAAMRKLEAALRGVIEHSDPVTEAQTKLAHAQDIVNQAVASGSPKLEALMNAYGGAGGVMADFERRLHDQLEPFDAVVTKIIEQTSALRVNAEEQARATEMEKLTQELKQKGIQLSEHEVTQLERLVTFQQSRARLIEAERHELDAITGPARAYQLTVEALNDLQSHGTIDSMQYAKAIRDAKDAFDATTPYAKSFEYGLDHGLRDVADTIRDIATQVRTTLVDAFKSVEDSIVSLVTTGKIDFAGMVTSMLGDLTRLLLRMLLVQAIGASAFGPSTALPTAAVSTSIAGASLGAAAGIGAFATGGEFQVGGQGGTDSQLVAFRASPDETVRVTRPDQRQDSQTPEVHVHLRNVTVPDQEAAYAAQDSRRGVKTTLNTLRQNKRWIRGFVTGR